MRVRRSYGEKVGVGAIEFNTSNSFRRSLRVQITVTNIPTLEAEQLPTAEHEAVKWAPTCVKLKCVGDQRRPRRRCVS